MKIVFSKGSLVAIALFFLIFLFFPKLMDETPVNLLGIGGSNGSLNLMINIFFYSIITLFFTTLFGYVSSDKRKWLTANLIGICFSSLSLFVYIIIYLSLFWGNNGL